MKAVGKGDHVLAACDLARQFQGGLDRVGAGRAGHHHLVIHATRFQDEVLKRAQERGFGVGVHVQSMGDAVTGDMLDQGHFHVRIVVPIVQGRTP